MARCKPFKDNRARDFLNMTNAVLRNSDNDNRVVCCNDHKGLMHVYWADIPSDSNMNNARRCWEMLGETELAHVYLQPVFSSSWADYSGIEGQATRSSD